MMKQSFRSASLGVAMAFVLSTFALLSIGCGAIDANGFLGLETCDILNCDGLFFANLAGDHDDVDDDHIDDADDHDDEDDHAEGDDDHADDTDDHDDEDDDVDESEDHTHG